MPNDSANQDFSERDKLFVDMYADIRAIQEAVERLEKAQKEDHQSLSSIKQDIHAVKVSARLIKWMAALIGAVAGLASGYIRNFMGSGNG